METLGRMIGGRILFKERPRNLSLNCPCGHRKRRNPRKRRATEIEELLNKIENRATY